MGEVLAEIERPKHPPKECHVEPDTGDIFMWSNRDATPNVWRWKTVPDVLMMLKAHE